MKNSQTEIIKCQFIYASAKAIHLMLKNGNDQWFPKSVIENYPDNIEDPEMEGEEIEVEVHKWFLDKNDIEYEV
jgi:hypothetical protein